MLTATIIAILASSATEVVAWLNEKLTELPALRGRGAFLVALVMSFVGAVVKMFWFDNVTFSWSTLVLNGGAIFTTAQVYFMFVAQKLGLEVKHG